MIGSRLKELRTKAGYSQVDLGERIGTSGHRVWQWESDRVTPDTEMIAKLARALNTSTDYLLSLTDNSSAKAVSKEFLSAQEWAVINALRQGNRLEAIHIIASGE